ncbi:XdhC family protein [Brevibacillus sp. NRS-1366]|uniref:XdhC family protein n=1 Tax=Brevibacillus sp. NRS-1366 TaxID=3233899 RepID=UPI003D1DA713
MSRMQEMRDIFHHIRQAWARGQQTALLMITEVRGSAYRQPGTKMMMAADGQMFGMLSGGCLESDLFGWAERAMSEQTPILREYNLSENDLWGLGIGCKGSLKILVLPIDEQDIFWRKMMEAAASDQPFSFVLEVPTGLRVLFDQDGNMWGEVAELPEEVRRHTVMEAEQRTRAQVMQIHGRQYVIDTVRPSERLIVAGAGHDAVPVVQLAHTVGFSVTVLDPRSEFNDHRRFPVASHMVKEPSLVDYSELSGACWVIMNHYQKRDEESLKVAIKSNPRYIGVLGPLSRTKEMLSNIGFALSDGPIHAPIGLDLAAETIDEVAISIVSELMVTRSKRDALSLHGREKIHV